MRKPFQDTTDNSVAVFILNNADRRFSPDYTASPLFGKVVPQRLVRITSFDGVTERVHWMGWIEVIQPEVNAQGSRIVKIMANGTMQFYRAAETQLPLQENKRTSDHRRHAPNPCVCEKFLKNQFYVTIFFILRQLLLH